ncbi:MAG: hypothetical protein A2X49_02885 [Lentisphaerae bacterium GWF2_52_8]|nr:MAG: hypothetical protein A2X49_02885 [Lentisphaerae bacterium GWF2_52_8]
MSVNWMNPYAGASEFQMKGNLHTHTLRSGCGKLPLEEVVRVYEKMNYSFIAITDHNVKTEISGISSESLSLLPGIEIDIKCRHHFGVVHAEAAAIFHDPGMSQQEIIDRNIATGALVTLHHPDWELREHYTVDELLELKNYDGIEIYNTVIEFLDGASLSTAKWDRLLASGRRVLGFANQDFHDYPHALDCCNFVSGNDRTPKGILKALKNGQFYCHYGVRIKSMGRCGSSVFVETENAKLIRFVGFGGVILKKCKASSAEIEFKEDSKYKYVRIECLGEGEDISFSQPFFREI